MSTSTTTLSIRQGILVPDDWSPSRVSIVKSYLSMREDPSIEHLVRAVALDLGYKLNTNKSCTFVRETIIKYRDIERATQTSVGLITS